MNQDTRLWRQVHPSFIEQEFPTSQTFRPTKKDEEKLSVDNGDIINAEESYLGHTEKGYLSVGVLAVTVGEYQEIDLEVEKDSDENLPAHAFIVFSGISKKEQKDKAKLLRDKAVNRGWQHKPTSFSAPHP